MGPLLLKPNLISPVWSGDAINRLRGIDGDVAYGESFDVSVHEGLVNDVESGPYDGTPLDALLAEHRSEIMGDLEGAGIVQIITMSAGQNLSVQVHPDEAYAQAHENDHEKTESWYIVEAEPGATIICGSTTDDVDALVFMFRLNPLIAGVVTVLTPFSVWMAKFISSHASKHFAGQTQLRGELTGLVEEMIGGVGTIEAFGVADEVCGRVRDIDARLAQESYKAVFFSSLANPTMRFMNSLVYAAIGIFGAFVVLGGGITVGGLSAFLQYADQYAKPFNDITGVVTELQNSVACARHLFELIDEPLEEPDVEGARELGRVEGKVALSDVTFSYVPGRPILEHLDLSAEPGRRIALVGHTGCGKTTLINLLMRFYDVDSGSVTVDGYDVRDLTRASLRGSWGMVLQDTWVRRATVRENIAIGRPDATDDEIMAAAKAAYADEFIRRMPHGYDTVLDGSTSLSAGQKQLLCIARVMVARPQMLILDEATSNIDTRTELLVQRAFDNLMHGRTSFVVAHRLSTIRDADAICVVDHGRIAEKGTHEELLARGGIYRDIYESQFAPAE